MRILSALALTFSLAACGGSSKSTEDLSSPKADMTVSLGCGALVNCVQACNGGATCEQNCSTMGSANGTTLFKALFTCAYGVCLQPGDGGAAACTSATDLSAGCQACVAEAALSSTCSSQFAACEANQ